MGDLPWLNPSPPKVTSQRMDATFDEVITGQWWRRWNKDHFVRWECCVKDDPINITQHRRISERKVNKNRLFDIKLFSTFRLRLLRSEFLNHAVLANSGAIWWPLLKSYIVSRIGYLPSALQNCSWVRYTQTHACTDTHSHKHNPTAEEKLQGEGMVAPTELIGWEN